MATSYGFAGPKIVRDGLVLYLDAASPNSYNLSAPLTWRDISKNNNNGSLINGVNYSNFSDGSMIFDGIDDFIKINNNQVANNLPSMTVSIWIYAEWVNQTLLYHPIISKLSDIVNGAGWELGYIPGGTSLPRSFYFFTQNNGGSIYKFFNTNSLNLTNNTWVNITASYTNNFADILIYINGVNQSLVNQSLGGTLTSISTTSSVVIASRDGPNTFGVKFNSCRVSSAQIYNRVLSQSEITQNFNATRGRFGI